MSDHFNPPYLLRNRHLQTLLASRRPPGLLGGRKIGALLGAAEKIILDCGDGVRLLGSCSCRSRPGDRLAVLLHGWEGSIDSAYLLHAASTLFAAGFDVFRLNLRDHGDSHHLNRELFNSTRLEEVTGGIAEVCRLFPRQSYFLAGFSLGGNFALRLGLRAPAYGLPIRKIVAVSPLISPANATARLERDQPFYHRYFVRKWKRSLAKKLFFYPDLGYGDSLLALHSLGAMNDYFVPHHTAYSTAGEYLDAYALIGDRLAGLTIDSHILTAVDDPITTIDDLALVTRRPPALRVEVTRYGGHCGFLQDFSLTSWADQRLVTLFR